MKRRRPPPTATLNALRTRVDEQGEQIALLLQCVRAEFRASTQKRHKIVTRVERLEEYVQDLAEGHDEGAPGRIMAPDFARATANVESMSDTPSLRSDEEDDAVLDHLDTLFIVTAEGGERVEPKRKKRKTGHA